MFGQGKLTDAKDLAEQALSIRQRILEPNDPLIAVSLNYLAAIDQERGEYLQALPLLQRALKIRETALGPNHSDTTASVNNLATLYYAQGDFAAALPLMQRALETDERILGSDHLCVSTDLNNLGELYQKQGDFAQALPLLQRALRIDEKLLPANHPGLAIDLTNLAALYHAQQDYAAAIPLCERAYQIRLQAFGSEHPIIATDLNSLAELYQAQGDYANARGLYEKALAIRQKALGEEHPLTALSLNNLAGWYCGHGEFDRALPLLEKALATREKILGPDHPDLAFSLNNLGLVYQSQANYAEAIPLLERAAKIMLRHLELTSVVQAERQQLADIRQSRSYLDDVVSCALLAQPQSIANSASNDGAIHHSASNSAQASTSSSLMETSFDRTSSQALAQEAYRELLSWKGTVTLRQRLERAARHTDNSEEQQMWKEFQLISTRLANLSRMTPSPEQRDTFQWQLAALTKRKEQIEADLSRRSIEFRKLRGQMSLAPDEIANRLPSETALVDFLQFTRRVNEKQPDGTIRTRGEQRLAAFVVRHDRPVEMVDLGLAEPIDSAVDQWRSCFGTLADRSTEEQPGTRLRRLIWEPLRQYLPGIQTVLISPDGEIAKFPWNALPSSKANRFLIEDGISFALITVPQMLPALLEQQQPTPVAPASTMLLVGDINYGATLGPSLHEPSEHASPTLTQASIELADDQHRSAVRGQHGLEFPPLPGTRREIDQIASLYRSRFAPETLLELTQDAATQSRIRLEAPKYRFLHLATHGFFAPATIRSAFEHNSDSSTTSGTIDVIGFNPGLLSGIALAGCRHEKETPDDDSTASGDDGILTALEVATLDLAKTDLVVLSACETRLGQSTAGEGMLGLERAFQLAGAKTTVASLWSVDDAATQSLMSDFYQRLWDQQHPVGKLAALSRAQLDMLNSYDPYTQKLSGKSRGIELSPPDARPASAGQRLSPKYWAAFELSGDWR